MNTPATFIAFASPKGGVGKSTSCLSIAGALLAHGYKVRIVDFDQTETIWRWYSSNPSAQAIAGLAVEKGPQESPERIAEFLHHLYATSSDFVLIDLAGALTDITLRLAAFATLTITPAKLSEPDIQEGLKLAKKLRDIGARIGKPIAHRILINERLPFLSSSQAEILNQLDNSPLQRFPTEVYNRAAYGESFMTGVLPHFADRKRPAIAKAVDELDKLLVDLFDALGMTEQKAAA